MAYSEYYPKKKPAENALGHIDTGGTPIDLPVGQQNATGHIDAQGQAVNYPLGGQNGKNATGHVPMPMNPINFPVDWQDSQPGQGGGGWDQMVQDLWNRYQNRGPFQYDPNSDPLWQGVKDQYIQGGQRAMQDTMGQATALTGGYASSYAETAGQQQFNDFMTKLSAQLPAAYDRARAAYDAEGDNLLQQLSVAQGMADTAYQRDRDKLADERYETEWNWQTEQAALDRERQDRLDAADQAYREWQMGRATAEDARDIALMMIQCGKTPSNDLLTAAGINPADAKTMANFYAGQYAAASTSRSTGGSTPTSTTPQSQTPTYTTQEVNDAYKAAKQAILMSGQTGNINYAVNTLDKYADYLTPEMAAELMDMLDRIRKNIANPDPNGDRNKNNRNSGGSVSKPGTGGGGGGKWVDMIM